MRRTKMICTIGPASETEEKLRDLMLAGMNVARFNFSHGTHEEHREKVDMIKNIRDELNIPVAILLDTKGPEIRTKLLKDGKKITLQTGQKFTLTTGDYVGDENMVAITYETLYKDVKKLLIENFNVKHIHGGESTKHKYEQLRKEINKNEEVSVLYEI